MKSIAQVYRSGTGIEKKVPLKLYKKKQNKNSIQPYWRLAYTLDKTAYFLRVWQQPHWVDALVWHCPEMIQ